MCSQVESPSLPRLQKLRKNLLRIDSSISKDYCEMTDELWKLKSMKFNCSNEKQGCEEILEEQALISHEIDCIYLFVTCPRYCCGFKVPFYELPQHLKDESHHFVKYSMLKGNKTERFSLNARASINLKGIKDVNLY